jgi:hypothetical protein
MGQPRCGPLPRSSIELLIKHYGDSSDGGYFVTLKNAISVIESDDPRRHGEGSP